MADVTSIPLFIDGAFIVEFSQHHDKRGFFEELYNVKKYPAEVPVKTIQQLSCSHSKANVFRGLHCSPYYKLVTCVSGGGYDIIADLRRDSPTFLKWVRVMLTESNHRQVFVPAGCGHGFYSLHDQSILVYAQGGTFSAENDLVVSVKDPILNIELPNFDDFIISEKDRDAKYLNISREICLPERKRLLIIGQSGKIGNAVLSYVQSKCKDIVVYGTHFLNKNGLTVQFDLARVARDESIAKDIFDLCCPHVVLICGSWTNNRYCDEEPDKSRAVMTTGPANIAKIAAARRIKVAAISSDYVFSGERANGPYTETDVPNPISVYGRNKSSMEKLVLEATGGSALILRTTTVNGVDALHSGAFYTLYDYLQGGKDYFVPNITRSPTYVKDLAEMIVRMIQLDVSGIVHACGDDIITLLEYFRLVAKAMGLDPNKVKCREKQNYQPLYSAMSSEKRKKLLPDFKSCSVFECVEDWMKDEGKYCEEIKLKYGLQG